MLGGFPQLDSEHLPDAEPLLRPVFPTVQSARHGSRTGRAMGHSLSFFERADALRLVAEDIDGRAHSVLYIMRLKNTSYGGTPL